MAANRAIMEAIEKALGLAGRSSRETGVLRKLIGHGGVSAIDEMPRGATYDPEKFAKYLSGILDADEEGLTYGLRYTGSDLSDVTDVLPRIGQKQNPSRVWRYDENTNYFEPTRRKAEGTSVIELNPYEKNTGQVNKAFEEGYGDNYHLVASKQRLPLQDWNIDRYEGVLKDPRTLAIFAPHKTESGENAFTRIKGILPFSGGAGLASTQGQPEQREPTTKELTTFLMHKFPQELPFAQQPQKERTWWDEVQAGNITPEAGLKDTWSPIDLVSAPIGAAGTAGKAIAMALDLPAYLGIDKLTSGVSSWMDEREKQKIEKIRKDLGII